MADERIRYVLTADDQTRGAFQSVRSNIEGTARAVSQIRAVGATFFGVAGLADLKQAGAALIDARVQTEKLQNTLSQAVGLSGLRAELGFIRDQAGRLGLEFQSTAQAYAKFAAASRGTSLEGAQTREIFIGVAQAASALGLSSEETAGALTAVQQIISKGKVSAEELRGQLGERLPGAFQIAARSIGVTTQQLDAMLASGSLVADDFLPRFARQLQVEFADAAQRAAASTQSSLNRIQTAWNDLKNITAQGPVGDAIKGTLDVAAGAMERFAKNARDGAAGADTLLEKLIALSQYNPAIAGALPLVIARDRLQARGAQRQETEQAYSTWSADAARQFPPRPTASQIRALDNPQVDAITRAAREDVRKLMDSLRAPGQKLADEIAELRRLGGLTGTDVSGAIAEARRRASAGAAREAERELDARKELEELISQSVADDNIKEAAAAQEAAADAALRWLRRLDEAEQAADALAESNRRTAQSFIDLGNPAAKYVRQLDEIQRLSQLSPEAGGLSGAQAEAARLAVLDAWKGLRDKGTDPVADGTRELTDAARELGLTFQSAFEDAIVGGKSFGDVLKGLADDLTRLIIRKSITEPLAKMASDAIGPLFGGKRAEGGPMSAGMAYLVGERGPELVVPRQSGTVIPAGKFGGSVTVIPQIAVTDQMSRAEVYDLVARVTSETASAVLASMQRNGAFARA